MTDDKKNYCERHDIDIDKLPSGYNSCPYCDEEARIQGELEHMMTRDPTMEPW